MAKTLTIVGLGGSMASNSKTLGGEVVRVAERFAADASLHRQAECTHAAERVATVA